MWRAFKATIGVMLAFAFVFVLLATLEVILNAQAR